MTRSGVIGVEEAALVDPAALQHLVQFYEHDAFLTAAVAQFVGDALQQGDRAVVIATLAHRKQLEERLHAFGVDLRRASSEGRYVAVDAADTLATFMRNGTPDPARFADVVGSLVRQGGGADSGRVRAFGEMVSLLWAAGNERAAIALEELWNELARRHPFSLLCAYPISAFRGAGDESEFLKICSAHSHVIPAESYPMRGSIDERARAITLLQRRAARTDADTATREKDEFLAMLGHELRNPLSAIRNAIVGARLDGVQRERALDIAQRQTDYLARLVDDLLDVARITRGRIMLHKQALRLGGIIERSVETTRALMEERGHTLTLSLPAADVLVDGDATRLEQAVVNLLTNAANYTSPGGQITITAAANGHEAELSIRDTGCGISAELLPRVFDLFAQGDRALDRAPGGLGVGLTVARRLVELHGGRIEARSDGPGKGAEFIVRLPVVAAATENTADDRPTPLHARHRTRILIVEDNVDAADSLMLLLELLGHDVRVVPDGMAAIALARANVPDVMLIDIGLPGMSGYEVARQVRQDPTLKGAVLIALTGYGRAEDKQRAIESGFDYHLVKPVDPAALQELVVRLGESEPPPAAPLTGSVH